MSVTSELTMSLSDLEKQSVSGMASIVLTDSDEELEVFSDTETFGQHGHAGYHVPPFSPPLRHESKPPSYLDHYSHSIANNSHRSLSPMSHHYAAASSHCSSMASSSHSLPVNALPCSDRLTQPGMREAVPAISGESPRAALSHKQKVYVVTNGRTMGVFTHWYAQFLEDGIDINVGYFIC